MRSSEHWHLWNDSKLKDYKTFINVNSFDAFLLKCKLYAVYQPTQLNKSNTLLPSK